MNNLVTEYYFQVLELICTREAGAVFEAGGLQCSLTFIREFGSSVHKDTLHSAMNVVSRLCGRMEPQDTNLEACVKSLSTLLRHEDPYVSVGHNIFLTKYYSECLIILSHDCINWWWIVYIKFCRSR